MLQLPQRQGDGGPGAAVFQGVGHKIVDDLGDAEGVAVCHPAADLAGYGEGFLLLPRLIGEHFPALLHAADQVGRTVVHSSLPPLLDPGNVQNIVDQAQQLLGRLADFPQILPHLPRIILMLQGQVGETDHRIQGGAHVVGDMAEKDAAISGALFGRLQGGFQEHLLLQLKLLLRVHLPEAEDHLVQAQGVAVDHPRIDPAVAVLKHPLVVPAEVVDLLPDQAADILQGEALLKFPDGLLVHQLLHHLHQLPVVALRPQPGRHILGALHRLVGSPGVVDPVYPVVGVPQDGQRVGHPAQALPAQEGAEHREENHRQEKKADAQEEEEDAVHLPLENGVHGDGDHGDPSVVHLIVVHAPALPVQIADGGVEGLHLPLPDLAQQAGGVLLHLLLRPGQIRVAVNHVVRAVKEEEGASLRQLRVIFVDVKIVQKHVEGQQISRFPGLPGDGDHLPACDDILIGVCENGIFRLGGGTLIPLRILVGVIPISLPGSRRQDFPVHHRVRVHHADAQNLRQIPVVIRQPSLDLLPGTAVLRNLVHVAEPQADQQAIDLNPALLLRGVALRQGRSHLLGVLQNFLPHQENPPQDQGREGRHHRQVQPRGQVQSSPSVSLLLHPLSSPHARIALG